MPGCVLLSTAREWSKFQNAHHAVPRYPLEELPSGISASFHHESEVPDYLVFSPLQDACDCDYMDVGVEAHHEK